MKINLTHDLKVRLLEAIRDGEMDTSIVPSESVRMSNEELCRELARLHLFDDRDLTLAKANLMQRYANGEICSGQYVDEMAKLYAKS